MGSGEGTSDEYPMDIDVPAGLNDHIEVDEPEDVHPARLA